jgi:hypothetical protein
MPGEFGLWFTVDGRFRAWRDADAGTALLEGAIAEAARRRKTDLSLVNASSTTARAHHDAGMCIGEEVMDALEEVAADQERARQRAVQSSECLPRLSSSRRMSRSTTDGRSVTQSNSGASTFGPARMRQARIGTTRSTGPAFAPRPPEGSPTSRPARFVCQTEVSFRGGCRPAGGPITYRWRAAVSSTHRGRRIRG